LTRIIEACEIVSVRRATDLIAGCIRGLNNDELISASALARSLIELAASYGDAANYLNAYFKKFPWEEIDKKYLVSHDSSTTDEGRGLEGYIAALALAA